MFTLPVHSSLLPLPAFSIIREITHFPSNLTPQNLRKCVRARSLANFIFMIFTVILDLIHSVPICFWLRQRTNYTSYCLWDNLLSYFFLFHILFLWLLYDYLFLEEGKSFNVRGFISVTCCAIFSSSRNWRQVFSGIRK